MSGRHLTSKVRRTRRARTVLAAAGVAGVVALTSGASTTGATYTDVAAAQLVVNSTRWATSICVIQSVEGVEGVFSLGDHATMTARGWSNVVDKRAATTTTDLNGCGVVMIAGELWGPNNAAVRALANAWYAQGGSVLSTGNDSGIPTRLYPEMIAAVGTTNITHFPYGGSVPASLSTRAQLDPVYPSWTPSTGYTYDELGAYPVTQAAADAVCVGTVTGHPEWCAAIAKNNDNGGRWVHLHTKIGTNSSLGDPAAADASLAWLAVGNL